MILPAKAKLFIVILGVLFILSGIIISSIYEIQEVIPVGMGIIGLFLIILPFTYTQKKQQ